MTSATVSFTPPTTPLVPHDLVRTRPAFEKLAVGPLMVLGECLTGGHYLEVLRLGKQLTVGHGVPPSYLQIHQGLVQESRGFVGAFYRGFLPWGLVQCLKGLPVLFVQNESMYQLRVRGRWDKSKAEIASGFIGGAVQGVFVNPFQKIKVAVVASKEMNSMPPLEACKEVLRRHGVLSLLDGVFVMMLRRSLDWGIRFTVSNRAKHYVIKRKEAQGLPTTDLAVHELIGCGLIGGAASAMTHPIDCVITNSMKPMPVGTKTDVISVVRRMYAESGPQAFTRAWGIKIVDNAYHMAWMYGIGTVVYDHVRKTLADM
mmetsp:Transcript_48912/g.73000  ORF Transcript_48912/g.73000 Transcript_48912/m.73000 type:complete len:315 (-) Transcript_48912:1927-2871(-)